MNKVPSCAGSNWRRPCAPAGTPRWRTLVGLTGGICLALALGGCVGDILTSKADATQTYVLRTGAVDTAAVAYPVQLSVTLPSTTPGLDTARIAVLRNTNQLDYFRGARWGGTAPQVVQSFMVTLLDAQQGFKGVAAEGTRLEADYLLALELRDFQAEYAADKTDPVAHVTLIGTLVEIKSRKAIATVVGSAEVAAQDNRLGAVVAAFQSATQQAGTSLSRQVIASLNRQ